jgi:hypothetical protein
VKRGDRSPFSDTFPALASRWRVVLFRPGERNKRRTSVRAWCRTMSPLSQLLPDFFQKAEDAVNERIYIATRP